MEAESRHPSQLPTLENAKNPRKCRVCHKAHDVSRFVVCGGCGDAFHIYCLSPPLSERPKRYWKCATCTSNMLNLQGQSPESILQPEAYFYQYQGCQTKHLIDRVKYVMHRDGIKASTVAQQANLDTHSVIATLEGSVEIESHLKRLKMWLYDTDELFASHVRTRIQSVSNVNADKLAHAMAVPPEVFNSWLQRTIDFVLRERIDNILITKFPNLTKGRRGVYISSSAKRIVTAHGNKPRSMKRRKASITSELMPFQHKDVVSDGGRMSGASKPNTAAMKSRPQKPLPSAFCPPPSLGSALAARAFPQPPQNCVNFTPKRTFPSGSNAPVASENKNAHNPRNGASQNSKAEAAARFSAFTPTHRVTSQRKKSCDCGNEVRGPSREQVVISQSKINFENIVSLIDNGRYKEAADVAVTSALLLQTERRQE